MVNLELRRQVVNVYKGMLCAHWLEPITLFDASSIPLIEAD